MRKYSDATTPVWNPEVCTNSTRLSFRCWLSAEVEYTLDYPMKRLYLGQFSHLVNKNLQSSVSEVKVMDVLAVYPLGKTILIRKFQMTNF